MAIVGERGGLFPALRDWVQSGRPVSTDEMRSTVSFLFRNIVLSFLFKGLGNLCWDDSSL